jgi:perosamine synthetase
MHLVSDIGTAPLEAVVLAHTYGVLAKESDLIADWCSQHDVPLIEDASEAHGAMYANGQVAGSRGAVSIMSFRGEKTISGGQLGAVLTDDSEIARLVRQWSHNGLPCSRVRYWATKPGLNMQPAHLNAALACAQLERIQELVFKRNQVHAGWLSAFEHLATGVSESAFQSPGPHTPAWWLTALKTDTFTKMLPGDLGLALGELGVETRPGFYPLGFYPHVSVSTPTPVAENLLRTLLILPSGPDITADQQVTVVREIGRITGKW